MAMLAATAPPTSWTERLSRCRAASSQMVQPAELRCHHVPMLISTTQISMAMRYLS